MNLIILVYDYNTIIITNDLICDTTGPGCGCQTQFRLIGIRSDQLPASDSSRLTFDFFFVQSIATTRVLALVHTAFTISLKHSMKGVVQSTIWSLNCTRSPFETHAKPRG